MVHDVHIMRSIRSPSLLLQHSQGRRFIPVLPDVSFLHVLFWFIDVFRRTFVAVISTRFWRNEHTGLLRSFAVLRNPRYVAAFTFEAAIYFSAVNGIICTLRIVEGLASPAGLSRWSVHLSIIFAVFWP